MRALVLCAGFGTRFRPATETTPKPLLPLLGAPILERLLLHLRREGITSAVLNAHHLASELQARVGSSCAGLGIDYSFEDPILGTAGAIRRAAARGLLPDEPFAVVNGDLFTTLPLAPVVEAVRAEGTLSALAVLPNERPEIDTPLWGDADGRLAGVGGSRPFPSASGPWLFTGIQVARRTLADRVPEGFAELARDVLVPSVLSGERAFALVAFHPPRDGLWFDLGTPERLAAAEEALRRQEGSRSTQDVAIQARRRVDHS